MNRIFKYKINVTDKQTVALPKDAQILTVQVKRGLSGDSVCLWALIEDNNNGTE